MTAGRVGCGRPCGRLAGTGRGRRAALRTRRHPSRPADIPLRNRTAAAMPRLEASVPVRTGGHGATSGGPPSFAAGTVGFRPPCRNGARTLPGPWSRDRAPAPRTPGAGGPLDRVGLAGTGRARPAARTHGWKARPAYRARPRGGTFQRYGRHVRPQRRRARGRGRRRHGTPRRCAIAGRGVRNRGGAAPAVRGLDGTAASGAGRREIGEATAGDRRGQRRHWAARVTGGVACGWTS